jgi:hypothetical protein
MNKVVKDTSSPDIIGIDFCQDFISLIVSKNWKKLKTDEFRVGNNIYKFFVGDKSYWEKAILANQFCFRGKSKVEIQELLGEPSRVSSSRNRTFYFIGKTKEDATWQLQLNFDDNNILTSISDTVMFID